MRTIRALVAIVATTALACSSSSSGGAGDAPADLMSAGGSGGAAGQGAGGDASGGGGQSSGGHVACDPLAPITKSVTLDAATIVGAGRDAAGVVYVIEGTFPPEALFISQGAKLVEVPITGSGAGDLKSTGGSVWLVDYDDAGVEAAVEVDADASGTKRMGVGHGPFPMKTLDIGVMGEELALVDPAAVAAMPAETTATFRVEWSATDSSGNAVVITSPDHADGYDGFRFFVGAPSDLQEAKVTSVSRTHGIPSTTIMMVVIGGVQATLTWTSGSGSLSRGGGMTAFTEADGDSVPAGATFSCL